MREYLLKKLYLGHSWSERVNDLDAIYFNYNSCLMKGDTDDNESCRSSFPEIAHSSYMGAHSKRELSRAPSIS